MGIPLHCIPNIRQFFQITDLFSSDKIDFDGKYMTTPAIHSPVFGHTIAARITAENPLKNFQPTLGAISEINLRSMRNVWGYFSVDSSGCVHEYADSQIGHIFSWGKNREEARHNLVMALQQLTIRGDICTSVEYLKDLIELPEYRDNQFDIKWLDKLIKLNLATSKIDPLTIILINGICTTHKHISKNVSKYRSMLECGQLPPSHLLNQSLSLELIYKNLKYNLLIDHTGPNTFCITINNSYIEAELNELRDEGYLILIAGKSHVVYLNEDKTSQKYIIDGNTCEFPHLTDPRKLQTSTGGKLLNYLVKDGENVIKKQSVAQIEVMKMVIELKAVENGIINFIKPLGSILSPGDIFARMILDENTTIKQP